MTERQGRFVKTMDGTRTKVVLIAVTSYLVPRWYVLSAWPGGVTRQEEEYVIFRDDKVEAGVYRVYRELPRDTKEFLGFAPSIEFALRMCVTETQRLYGHHPHDERRTARENEEAPDNWPTEQGAHL